MAVSRFALLSAAALACAVAFAPAGASAGPGYAPPANDAQAVELHKMGRDKKTNFLHPGTKTRWGRAEMFIDAPWRDVRKAVLDYGNYSSFIRVFQKSKLLKREKDGAAEAYLQMQVLKGAATLWAVERFDPPVPDGKGEKIVGHMVKGNVDDLQAVWRYRPVDDNHTVLVLELYAAPRLMVPSALMLSQLEDACGEGVLSVRDLLFHQAKMVATTKP
jgi:ribosome-associated toxin RatA of RatAB toxin-antitoxin module